MKVSYVNALSQIDKAAVAELAGKMQYTNYSLTDQCTQLHMLSELTELTAKSFTGLIDAKIAASQNEFDKIMAADANRATAIPAFKAVVEKPLDFAGTIDASLARIDELVTKLAASK